MVFARKVWKLLVGVKDALALIFLLLFFVALFGILSVRPNPGLVRDGALLLDLDGVVVEEVAPVDPIAALLSQSMPVREYAVRDLVRAIDAAAEDPRINVLALDLTAFLGGGYVHMQELSDAVERFKATEKPVYTYAFAMSDDALMLAAHSDEIWVNPLGGAAITGPGGEQLYYANALEQFDITANVYRVGTYKSAVEPWTESAMSEEARENMAQLLSTIWGEWRANIAAARPDADIDLVTGDVAAWLAASNNDLAQASLAAGLADRIGTRVEWGERVAEAAGADEWTSEPGAFAATDFDAFLADVDANFDWVGGDKIGVVTIAGEITDGDVGPGSAGAERIERILDAALDTELDALVVRVDSPGGSVTGSETIRQAILRYKDAGIPIAVSMGNYAASGGYWVATPGDRIFAEPETLTGSIGVFAVFPSFENVLTEYGVTTDGVRTTGLSGQPDLLGGLTPEVDALLQGNVENIYARFLGIVAESRSLSLARADELAQGRVWDGGAARQLGLVDQFGGLDTAIVWAAEQAELAEGSYDVVYLGEGADQYGSLLSNLLAAESPAGESGSPDLAAMFARREMARIASILGDFEDLMGREGVQAHCLECSVLGAQPEARVAEVPESGWMGLAARFFAD
ncbi:signal peptide peptidase SppA [Erythrobacter sp. EC-HK427]|uniref:signal peptide peptidase SppA n=1 Tax=Erythrobacter sp. EC-HK427 TaxID=2038396 RepID=UPI00125C43C7|nr:signal peptide peptidase SppA [Erythrobacter sp. EC-HK427]VVS98491.1 Protease 4 [Erythrobacter sp. EC-HK427]